MSGKEVSVHWWIVLSQMAGLCMGSSAVCFRQVAARVHVIDCVSAGWLLLLWGWDASVCKRASNFPHVDNTDES